MHNNTKRGTRQQLAWLVWFVGLLAQLVLYTISWSHLAAFEASDPMMQLPGLTAAILDVTGLLFWCYSLFLLFSSSPRWLKGFWSLVSLCLVLWTVYVNLAVWG